MGSSSRTVARAGAELGLPRYKFMVQVVIGEQRGEGVRMGCRTFWDTDTDAYASDTFINVRIARARQTHANAKPHMRSRCAACFRVSRTAYSAWRPHTEYTCTDAAAC